MKLLFQSDDYGITEGVTCGILKGIREGLIRNTGLFVNMPRSEFAAAQIKDYPQCCFGIDINLVAGRPVTPIDQIPHLVKRTGEFYTSGEIRTRAHSQPKTDPPESLIEDMEKDPYPLDETLIEVENQVKRFIELVGEKPKYIHPHSLMTANTTKALEMMAEKYDLPYSMNFYKEHGFHFVTNNWNPKPFSLEQQVQTDVEGNMLKVIPEVLEHELSLIICHAGFVDEDIFRCSTYTMIRAKDLFMACSPRIRDFIESNKVEIVRYDDFK
jgi:predicted glycoside hydrolase/deacetylase ChbG (UPF0249 family)